MVPAELCLLCRVWNQKQVAVKTKTSALDCGALCVERSTFLQLRFSFFIKLKCAAQSVGCRKCWSVIAAAVVAGSALGIRPRRW